MQQKFIVITGGVLSGLGKGVTIASIGSLLSSNHNVIPIKCDGYLNIDPGTMNPVEHGEVFVLDDGGEADMDFGHYERFLNISCTKDLNLTMGKVFLKVIEKERKGDFLGKNVQLIPDVSNYITDYYIETAKKHSADICLIEIGGTVGDMENELFIQAVKELALKVGKENVVFIHLTYVPIPSGVDEQKSKPTQQSVAMLMQRGIIPDILIARCEQMLTESIKNKISVFCNIKKENVFTAIDVDDVYKIPLIFEAQKMNIVLEKLLKIKINPISSDWKKLVSKKEMPSKEITIGIAGKYTALEDSYASIIEALKHCSAKTQCKVNIKWIDTEKNVLDELKNVQGVIVPGGFGSRGVEGKIETIKYCRENKIPFLGICYGLQMAVIEYARNVCNIRDANTTEVKLDCTPLIDILEEQKNIQEKGGTMRLGSYPAILKENTLVHSLYDSDKIHERHRHRYEVNPNYLNMLQENGLVICGMSPNRTLTEFIELNNHPFFVATQAHPELKSSLLKPAPLFLGFVEAIIKNN